MKQHKLHEVSGTTAPMLCALSLLIASAPAWSEANVPKYSMAVFSDADQGARVLSGRYEQAITRITAKANLADDLHAQTNLCVAYAKSGYIASAEEACETAVVTAESLRKARKSQFSGQTTSQLRARYLAIALSNRGVVKAVKGDLDAAREDFDAALAQQSDVAVVETNRERLEIADEETA